VRQRGPAGFFVCHGDSTLMGTPCSAGSSAAAWPLAMGSAPPIVRPGSDRMPPDILLLRRTALDRSLFSGAHAASRDSTVGNSADMPTLMNQAPTSIFLRSLVASGLPGRI
jgi:hypothetical protein